MKCKIFTLVISLIFLLGISVNSQAATITANTGLSAGANWSAATTWSGGVIPTYADSVVIPAGDSIVVDNSSYSHCNTLIVNGIVYPNTTFYVSGDIVVNSSGKMCLKSNVYCSNVYNYGKVTCPGAGYSGSPKTLFVGYSFTYNGSSYTTVNGTGDYVVVNDGIFGDTRANALAGKSGSGIYLYYSNLASSFTIRPSSRSVTGASFNIAAMLPNNSGTSTQNFTLNIQQSIALLRYSTVACFSLQNSDAFTGTRTCNIAAGDTLFAAGYFHAKSSAPSASQGTMIYNVNGCLDMASVCVSGSLCEMDLLTSATSPSITLNVNDGASLIFGKVVRFTTTSSAESITFNPSSSSILKFGAPTGLTVATPVYMTNVSFPVSLDRFTISNTKGVAFTMAGVTPAIAQTLVGGNTAVAALTISNSAGVTLTSPLTVSGILSLSTGNLTLGNNTLTVGSASGASSSSYVVTNGTGTLTQTAATIGTSFPVGTTTGYAPVTVTPASAVSVAASVSGTTTGTYTGYLVNSDEWTLTPASTTTAVLAFTPTTAANTSTPVVFSGSGYAAANPATLSTNTYSVDGISLATGANIFATGGIDQNSSVNQTSDNKTLVYSLDKTLYVENANKGDVVSVYALSGIKVASKIVADDRAKISLLSGLYLVKVGNTVTKVIVK